MWCLHECTVWCLLKWFTNVCENILIIAIHTSGGPPGVGNEYHCPFKLASLMWLFVCVQRWIVYPSNVIRMLCIKLPSDWIHNFILRYSCKTLVLSVHKYLCLLIVFEQYNSTALHLASENGHDKVIRILLIAKADVNTQDKVSCLSVSLHVGMYNYTYSILSCCTQLNYVCNCVFRI